MGCSRRGPATAPGTGRGIKKGISQAASPDSLKADRKQLAAALKKVISQEDRVSQAYIHEAMDLDCYKLEMERLRKQKTELRRRVEELNQRHQLEQHSRYALEHLNRFSRNITHRLNAMTFEERQTLLQLLVEKVTVEDGRQSSRP